MNWEKKRFLASLAALLAKMAMADGIVSQAEYNRVFLIWQELKLTPKQTEYAFLAFEFAREDGVSLERYISEFVTTHLGYFIITEFGIDARELLYVLMWDIACADGILRECEKSLLKKLPNELGLPPDSFDIYYRRYVQDEKRAKDEEIEARRRAEERARRESHRRNMDSLMPRDLNAAYALLGCEFSVSDDVVRKAYRVAVMRWHPDRLCSESVSQELIAKANEKMAAFNVAWDMIKRHRGIA